jgi:hypothetical protein
MREGSLTLRVILHPYYDDEPSMKARSRFNIMDMSKQKVSKKIFPLLSVWVAIGVDGMLRSSLVLESSGFVSMFVAI